MPLDLTAVRFAAAVADLAEGLLGETAGADNTDGCPQGDPHCYAPLYGTHQLCQYLPPSCTEQRRTADDTTPR